ncbi:transmembrane protein 41A-A-like isoform X2 [Corticium candelabrum]|uniref:transmembrane protein 41A-A-like isoform X2 n=1 Tax=Corticium candelabrum TaxID=121492 RepID=UPI002E25BBD5|nr:transmembrane protein 41A-A-like isoform X2 [Corticium candelabrum]
MACILSVLSCLSLQADFCYSWLSLTVFLQNVLAGALFGLQFAFPLVCFLTAAGATCCYTLSRLFGISIINYFFKKHFESFQSKVSENNDGLFFFLLFLRLFPMTPNWLINIASPLVGVPIHLFFLSVFIGLMPYNFLCCQAGVVLSQLTSLGDLFSWKVVIQLAVGALASLIPGLYFRRRNSVMIESKSE